MLVYLNVCKFFQLGYFYDEDYQPPYETHVSANILKTADSIEMRQELSKKYVIMTNDTGYNVEGKLPFTIINKQV